MHVPKGQSSLASPASQDSPGQHLKIISSSNLLASHPSLPHLVHHLSLIQIKPEFILVNFWFITSAIFSPPTFAAATVGNPGRTSVKVNYITGLNYFSGLKAHNNVVSVGQPVCTEQSFAKVVSSLKAPSKGKGRGGGALSSTCNAVGEIFRIAAIMNGLVLIGVAVGFVLLRIEASLEEAV
ncbi:uncharacterized protein LOC111281742 [Durio zibethinus]|uniref:Uncharacterized protein LOC111281742 n=1 Tax=Durio zibethinus TaxID=66656 RepID=A0A6P5XBW8_DURZI|nr:uncharacterized protein LOC111281742 [Durio zibethinus]